MFNTRWQPFGDLRCEMNRLQEEMQRLFGRCGTDGPSSTFSSEYPALNIWDDDEAFHVEAELPGLELSDLEIYVTAGDRLTIKGERKAPAPEKATWHRRERGCGTFSRTIELPGLVDAEQVTAQLKTGVLTVKLPKAAAAKPHKVEVVA